MKSVRKNFAWQTMVEMLKILLPIITSPYLARALGSEGVGIFAYTQSVAFYYTMFMDLGLYLYGRRTIARVRDHQDQLNKTFSDLFTLHFIISLFVGSLYFYYSFRMALYRTVALIQGLSVIASFFSLGWLYHGLEDIKETALRFLPIKTISFALILAFVKGEYALIRYTVLIASSNLISELILWINLNKKISFVKPSIKGVTKHLPDLLVLFIPVALESVYHIMDKIMLGNLSSITEVGYYEYASKALITRNVITALGAVLLPRIANLYVKHDYQKMWGYIDQSLRVSVILSVALSFGVAAVSSDFAPLFWGMEFSSCSGIMEILSFSTPFWTVAQVIRTQYLIPTGKDREYIASIFIGAIVNLTLNLLLIQKYNGMGAATATLIAEMVVCLYQIYIVRNEFYAINTLMRQFIYVVFAVIMLLIVVFLKEIFPTTWLFFAIEVIAGIILYGGQCLFYWIAQDERFYLELIEKILHRFRQSNMTQRSDISEHRD